MTDYSDYIREFVNSNARPAMQKQSGSRFDDMMLRDLPVAMAYVPMQTLGKTYEPECALENGTLFEALNKPFLGKRERT